MESFLLDSASFLWRCMQSNQYGYICDLFRFWFLRETVPYSLSFIFSLLIRGIAVWYFVVAILTFVGGSSVHHTRKFTYPLYWEKAGFRTTLGVLFHWSSVVLLLDALPDCFKSSNTLNLEASSIAFSLAHLACKESVASVNFYDCYGLASIGYEHEWCETKIWYPNKAQWFYTTFYRS